MLETSVCADKRIRAAVDLLLKAPMLTVAQAMRAVNCTDEESKNCTMQMQVRRALERKKGDTANNVNPFLTPPVGGDTPVAAVSSLTSASSGGLEVLFHQPKLKRIRRTASAMQQEWMNKLQKGNHFKDAMKRATLEYSVEMKKIGVNGKCVGKLSKKIDEEIKLQHDGVGPDACMVRRYVNKYSHIGMSPIKAGSKSDIPHWAFLSICTAFETYIAINQLNGTSSLNHRNKLSKILNAIFDV
jgi:hypothetical protein